MHFKTYPGSFGSRRFCDIQRIGSTAMCWSPTILGLHLKHLLIACQGSTFVLHLLPQAFKPSVLQTIYSTCHSTQRITTGLALNWLWPRKLHIIAKPSFSQSISRTKFQIWRQRQPAVTFIDEVLKQNQNKLAEQKDITLTYLAVDCPIFTLSCRQG